MFIIFVTPTFISNPDSDQWKHNYRKSIVCMAHTSITTIIPGQVIEKLCSINPEKQLLFFDDDSGYIFTFVIERYFWLYFCSNNFGMKEKHV